MIRAIKKLVNAIVSKRIAHIHTTIPAQVVSYDATKNTCSIQPCIGVMRTDDTDTGYSDFPQLDDIPVGFPGNGDAFLTCPVKADSYGIYHVAEEDINNWLNSGGVVAPSSVDRFNLDSGFFEPRAPWMFDSSFGEIATDRCSIRTRDGSAEISVLENGQIEIKTTGEVIINDGSDYGVQFTAMKTAYDSMKTEITTFVTAVAGHTHTGGAVAAPDNAAAMLPPISSMDGAKIESVRVP